MWILKSESGSAYVHQIFTWGNKKIVQMVQLNCATWADMIYLMWSLASGFSRPSDMLTSMGLSKCSEDIAQKLRCHPTYMLINKKKHLSQVIWSSATSQKCLWNDSSAKADLKNVSCFFPEMSKHHSGVRGKMWERQLNLYKSTGTGNIYQGFCHKPNMTRLYFWLLHTFFSLELFTEACRTPGLHAEGPKFSP